MTDDMREYRIRVTGPHCGTIVVPGVFTYPEAEAERERLSHNRHAREIEIIRADRA